MMNCYEKLVGLMREAGESEEVILKLQRIYESPNEGLLTASNGEPVWEKSLAEDFDVHWNRFPRRDHEAPAVSMMYECFNWENTLEGSGFWIDVVSRLRKFYIVKATAEGGLSNDS